MHACLVDWWLEGEEADVALQSLWVEPDIAQVRDGRRRRLVLLRRRFLDDRRPRLLRWSGAAVLPAAFLHVDLLTRKRKVTHSHHMHIYLYTE